MVYVIHVIHVLINEEGEQKMKKPAHTREGHVFQSSNLITTNTDIITTCEATITYMPSSG
jgi:hypothetical protein